MLHVDIPTRADIERLAAIRSDACLSIYLPTNPVTTEVEADRLLLKNLARSGAEDLRAHGADKKTVDAIEESLDDLVDDSAFWNYQANSLAVLATEDTVVTFRLPTKLEPTVEASDRFFIKPLLRAATMPQSAFVLALAQGSVRLVEVMADLRAFTLKIDEFPDDIADAIGVPSIAGRSPSGRIQGSEGQKVRMRQYARAIDAALRDTLAGRETPLILAATEPLDSIYRSVNTYPFLVEEGIAGSPEQTTDSALAAASRPILDSLYAASLKELVEEFEARTGQGRTTTDIAKTARAATYGAISVLLVDIDEVMPGVIAEDGAVTLEEASNPGSYGVVDEIARRALASGARVMAVRGSDIPGGGSLAAILRYPL